MTIKEFHCMQYCIFYDSYLYPIQFIFVPILACTALNGRLAVPLDIDDIITIRA